MKYPQRYIGLTCMNASDRADSGSGIAFQCIGNLLTKFQVIDLGKQVNRQKGSLIVLSPNLAFRFVFRAIILCLWA